MGALNSKYHVKIGDLGFLLAKQARTERHIYTREEAPAFVNKFSSGEPNYRDSTFFPHWVQLNWQNGFNQEFFDDGGKYYRSSAVDPTDQGKLKLQRKFTTMGQALAGVYILTQAAWRAQSSSYFGDGSDGTLTIASNTTYNAANGLIDSAASGTSGATSLSATNVSFAANQIILIHQSRGTNAGTWQKNKILAYSAGTITLQDPLNIDYGQGATKAQVIVLKQYSSITINAGVTLTADAWDTSRGGIIALLCSGTLTVTGSISADGKGYQGGSGGSGGSESGEGTTGPKVSGSANSNGNGGGGSIPAGGGAGGGGANATAGGNGAGGSSNGVGGVTAGNASLTLLVFGGGGGGGNDASFGNGGNGGGINWIAAKTLTVTGGITANGGNGGSANASGGGGGGGSNLLKSQTPTLGSGLVVANGGSGGSGGYATGGNGGSGRNHLDYLNTPSGTTTPTLDSTLDGTLADAAVSSSYTHYVGASNGKIYKWDNSSTFTEEFDTRQLTWYETGNDTNRIVGDEAGTERAQSQGFTLAAATKVKAISVYLKKNAGTPGDITVRIETNSAGVPSGTLADTGLAGTIPAFTTSTYGWVTLEFATAVQLSAATVYHLVLKTAAAANDNNYAWATDASSPSYSGGAGSTSADGGSTWSATSGEDKYFRILAETTSVNCSLVTSVGGTQKLYWGTGDPAGTTNGNARLYSYDGTTYALTKTFNTTNESSVLSLAEYGSTTPKMYVGLGHKAKIYSTSDVSTFTLSKTITVPSSPGYVLDMALYNGKLFVGGGYPEQLYGNNTQYGGFLYSYDEFEWVNVFPFDHTVVTALESFDTLLFIGTIKKRLYVFNTASVDKLFEFPWDVQIRDMAKWDDKLALAIAPTPGVSASGFEGIYLFDRNGFHNAFNVSSRSWYSLLVLNNNLVGGNDDGSLYQTSPTTYQASGTLQTSYDEASLPSIEKIRRSIILFFEAMPTNCSIQVEYKTDESDSSWTSLGTANTLSSTTAEFTFATGVYSKKITYRITLATSTPANTPVLKKIIHRYVLSPDFKYMWKMKLLCADDVIWQDGTEPVAIVGSAVSANATSITLQSSDNAVPTAGFPDPNGSIMYATIIDDDGTKDQFTYTGKTNTTLTGIPSSGSYALGAHDMGEKVKVLGRDMHQKILDLKETRQLYTFTDIDGITYTVLFHSYQADAWSINQDDYYGGLENEVPITLLEA